MAVGRRQIVANFTQESSLASHVQSHSPPHRVECFHDDRLVRPPQVQVAGVAGPLIVAILVAWGVAFSRVLPPGPGEPTGIHDGRADERLSAEGPPGSHYAPRLHRVRMDRPEREADMELRRQLRLHDAGGVLCDGVQAHRRRTPRSARRRGQRPTTSTSNDPVSPGRRGCGLSAVAGGAVLEHLPVERKIRPVLESSAIVRAPKAVGTVCATL